MHYPISIIRLKNKDDITTMRKAFQSILRSGFGKSHSYMMQPYENVLKKLSSEDYDNYIKSENVDIEFKLVANEIECAHIALSQYHEIYQDKISDKLMQDLVQHITHVSVTVKQQDIREQCDPIIPSAVIAAEDIF